MHGTVRGPDERNVVGRVKIWVRIICVLPRACGLAPAERKISRKGKGGRTRDDDVRRRSRRRKKKKKKKPRGVSADRNTGPHRRAKSIDPRTHAPSISIAARDVRLSASMIVSVSPLLSLLRGDMVGKHGTLCRETTG